MDDPRVLVGVGRARLTPRSRASRGTAGLTRAFSSARFALAHDGRVLWAPAPAHLAADLAPVPGRWVPDSGEVHVDCARIVDPDRRVTVRGRIDERGFRGTYELADGDDLHGHDVEMSLTDDPAALDAAGTRWIGRVPVPVRAHGTLSGTCDGRPVGSARLEIQLTDPSDGDLQPLELMLTSAAHLEAGSALWISGAKGLSAEDTGRYAVVVDGDEVRALVDSPTDTALGITFDVAAHPPAGLSAVGLAELPSIAVPVPARRARLRLRCSTAGATVSMTGELALDGRLSGGDVSLRATLEATGRRPTAADLDASGFERAWVQAGA